MRVYYGVKIQPRNEELIKLTRSTTDNYDEGGAWLLDWRYYVVQGFLVTFTFLAWAFSFICLTKVLS